MMVGETRKFASEAKSCQNCYVDSAVQPSLLKKSFLVLKKKTRQKTLDRTRTYSSQMDMQAGGLLPPSDSSTSEGAPVDPKAMMINVLKSTESTQYNVDFIARQMPAQSRKRRLTRT